MTSSAMKDKPFQIDKRQVYKAYQAVKSNKGAAGVDGQTLEQFATDWKRNDTSSDAGVMETINRREDRPFHSLVGIVASQYRIG
jgi:hypothetical protein